jgi:putative transposase
MLAVAELAPHVGLRSACQAFALNRGFVYRDRARHRATASRRIPKARPRPPLSLSIAEQDLLLGLLDSERFADVAPAAVFATLLDEGRYHGSIRTMYRLLAAQSQTGERRRQRIHPVYAKPELLAIRPNEVWSWDITKLKGPAKWTCFHLYVILDIFSRYVVGWLIAHRESAELAEQLIAETLEKENIAPGTLTLHADRGSSMRSKPVAALLIDLEVAKTHSRPHVSDDNPYSEAQFKTLKYRPDFPDRFGSIEDARAHCQKFFPWYNNEHRHGGIGLMAPAAVHHGTAAALTEQRAITLDTAFAAHPRPLVQAMSPLKRNCLVRRIEPCSAPMLAFNIVPHFGCIAVILHSSTASLAVLSGANGCVPHTCPQSPTPDRMLINNLRGCMSNVARQ